MNTGLMAHHAMDKAKNDTLFAYEVPMLFK